MYLIKTITYNAADTVYVIYTYVPAGFKSSILLITNG